MKRNLCLAVLFLGVILLAPVVSRAAPGAIQSNGWRIAVTQHLNVYLIDSNGANKRTVTTRGGTGGVSYPWYQWSPDFRYLLLVRSVGNKWDLLLMNSAGKLVRTLASARPQSDIYPSWAKDTDQIAYVDWNKRAGSRMFNAVNRIAVNGRKGYLWGYYGTLGCRQGTSDPAEQLYWQQTGHNGTAPTLQWSTRRQIAIFNAGCAGQRLSVVNLRTRAVRGLNVSWSEGALSPQGRLAAVQAGNATTERVVLTSLSRRTRVIQVSRGELPVWAPNGKALYFVQRTSGRVLRLFGPNNVRINSPTYTVSIWQTWADGSHPKSLMSGDGFGLGPMYVTPDNRSIVYSRVDNVWNLWNHRLSGNRVDAALLAAFGPHVNVQRLAGGGATPTIALDAARPSIRP